MAEPPRCRRGRSSGRALQDQLSEECLVLRGGVDALLERHLQRVFSLALPDDDDDDDDADDERSSARDLRHVVPAGLSERSAGNALSYLTGLDDGSAVTPGSASGSPSALLKPEGEPTRQLSSGRGEHSITSFVDDILQLAEFDGSDKSPREFSRPSSRPSSRRRPSWRFPWRQRSPSQRRAADGALPRTPSRGSLDGRSSSTFFGFLADADSERSQSASYRAFLRLCCGQRGQEWLEPVLSRVFVCIDWVYNLREPQRSGCLHRFVVSREWTFLCAVVITLNAVFAIYSTDYDASHYLEPTGFLGETSVGMATANIMFMVFYAVEIALKLRLHGLYFLCNEEWRWNTFDLMLVVFNVIDLVIAALISASDGGQIDVAFMRSLRILKLAKVLRIIRMFRIISELRLIMNSVIGSVVSLGWSFLVILFIVYLFGILFVQGVTSYFYHLQVPFSDEAEKMFGSTLAAMLTLYMAANGGYDWNEVYALLASTGWKNAFLFLAYIVFIQIAVLNIVTGIFVENAMKLAKPDHRVLAQEKQKKESIESGELRQICQEMDTDGNGRVSMQEFVHGLETSKKIRAQFAVLGLGINDAKNFFDTLDAVDDDSLEIDIEDFVKHCMRLKGPATSIDLHHLQAENRLACKRQQEFNDHCGGRMDRLTAAVAHLAARLDREEQGPPPRGQGGLACNLEHQPQPLQLLACGGPASPGGRAVRAPRSTACGAALPAATVVGRGASEAAGAEVARTPPNGHPAPSPGGSHAAGASAAGLLRRASPGPGGIGLSRLAAICSGSGSTPGRWASTADRGQRRL